MLVLEIEPGELVLIGDPANPLGRVGLTRISRDRVRLAFDFPRDIQVNRESVAADKLKRGIINPGRSESRTEQGRSTGRGF